MTILRTVSLVLASTIALASAASADYGQRDGRGNPGNRPHAGSDRPAVLPTSPGFRSHPVSPPVVIVRPPVPPVIVRTPPPVVYHEPRRPYGYWWKRDRDHRDFRGHHRDRRWYGWW